MASDARPADRPERLGWLTESAVQPRKRKMIEGVGTTGVLDLKAALYRQQQAAQQAQADPATAAERKSRKTAGVDVSLLVRKNAGVDARDQRDREQLQTPADRLAESYSALERKAQLYDRLATGQHDDEDELYNVDFLAKGTLQDELQRAQRESERRGSAARGGPIDSAGDAVRGLGGMSHPDMERERERRQWEDDEWRDHDEQQAAEARRDEKIEALERIEEETREMRDAAARRKAQREAQAAQQRDKLKEAFLKKQLAAKLASMRKAAAATGSQKQAGNSSEAPC